jgi:hypothetical protein
MSQLPQLLRLRRHVLGRGALLPAAGRRSRRHRRAERHYPFRIDHDEKFNQTTHVQYHTDPNSSCGGISIAGQPGIDLSGLTADEQFQAGLTCNGVKATIANGGFQQCLASQLTSKLLSIPAPGTEDDDKNPARIAPRSLFDASIGDDNLFLGARYKWSLRLTGVNLTNKYALYNFLSTFSGTHYVTPRALNAEIGFHF